MSQLRRTLAEPEQVQRTIEQFFELLEGPQDSAEGNLVVLADLLNQLAILARHPTYTFEDKHRDPPRGGVDDYRKFRDLAIRRFPGLQPYNLPDPVSESPGNAQLVVADPYDDLADIALDLEDVRWSFANTTPNDALWHFHFGFQSHWGDHANNLGWYLYALEFGR